MNTVEKNKERISREQIQDISYRYKRITRAINREFWDSESEVAHSRYVGSYGRGTAVTTSDIDVLVELPQAEYERYDAMKGNGQSRLLASIREAIKDTYGRTDVRADGQVVKVQFSDGIKFEVLPAFRRFDDTFIYADTNMGGNWLSTNPLSEQSAMKERDSLTKGLLKDTCKHIRYIRDTYFSTYKLSGIVVDSFVYAAIGDWHWIEPSSGESSSARGEYEKMLMGKFRSMNFWGQLTLYAPGSNQRVDATSSSACLEKVLKKMAGE